MAPQSDIPLEVKEEITAAARLPSGLGGKKMSINQIAARFNLSQPAQAAIVKGLKKLALANEMFTFDSVILCPARWRGRQGRFALCDRSRLS
jgi:hypothetical protein